MRRRISFSRIHPLSSSPERLRQFSREFPLSRSTGSEMVKFSFNVSRIEEDVFSSDAVDVCKVGVDSSETDEEGVGRFGEMLGSRT